MLPNGAWLLFGFLLYFWSFFVFAFQGLVFICGVYSFLCRFRPNRPTGKPYVTKKALRVSRAFRPRQNDASSLVVAAANGEPESLSPSNGVDFSNKSELERVRVEIAKKEAKLDALMDDFKAATDTDKQFYSKRVDATEAEIATLRTTEANLVSLRAREKDRLLSVTPPP